MSAHKVGCGKGNLEEKIIYRGPSEKATEVKSIAMELFGGRYVRLKRRGEIVSDPLEKGYLRDRNDESRIWIQYIKGVNCPDLLKILQGSKYEIFDVELPESASNVGVHVNDEEIRFCYKNYRIMLRWTGYPQVILNECFDYVPKRSA